jgi:prepilin-type N-terminal cleavage/methylation domain-containing protein
MQSFASSRRRAFTLIEMMIVVGIIGLIAAMGIPAIGKSLQKEGMRLAVSNVEEVFRSAREQAILGNKTVAAVFDPRGRRFKVDGFGKELSLPDGVEFGMLDIYRQEYVQSDWARIFFHADGTSDEAVIVLISQGHGEKITLEYATGLPVVSDTDQ